MPSERDRDFLFPVFYQVHSSAQMCLYQTPGRRPPRITGRFVNTVTRGSVGAPNERASFRFHGAVVVLSIDVCRGLGISPLRINIWLSFFSGRSWPKICPLGMIFFGFFKSLKLFFRRFVLIASGTEIFWRDIFEIRSFFGGNIAYQLSPV